ncbi:DNA primase [Streptomyces sp. NPDC048192]|uniref:DNA primase n=1 Tax=Streptomyces sp. NPDC048192 TaxID=3365510 RepID=UPI00371AFABC
MNRTALGLALGAGYLLGRTRKLKMAMAVGSVVAGKKLNLTPRGVAQLVSQQLRDNPQFKEIGDQLRQDLQGVGKAASGALVERQMSALADRLHSRTEQVRGQASGAVPGTGSQDEEQESGEDEEREQSADRESGTDDRADDADEGREDEQRAERPAKKAAQKKAPGRKDGERGAAARKTAARKTAKKTGAARKPAAKQTAGAGSAGGGRSRSEKGGDDR